MRSGGLKDKLDHLDYALGLMASSNTKFYPLFACGKRYLALMGGAGSGKSEFAMRKLIERLRCETNHRFLVARKVAATLRPSCFDGLKRVARKYADAGEFSFYTSEMRVVHKKSGNQILFAGLDDVEKLKSIDEITGIWIEEAAEIDEGDFNQLDIRLRGKTDTYLQIILTFNPVRINHWLKARFFDDPPEDALTLRTTYKDNRFLHPSQRAVLEGYKDKSPYFYAVYCLGEWGVTGESCFHSERLYERLSHLGRPAARGSFEGGAFIPEPDGPVRIYRHPRPDCIYAIGGDTAGEGSDFFTAQVVDAATGEQVATLRHRFDEDLYARQVFALGRMYNTALIALETNFSTYPMMKLNDLKYPNLYVRERPDTFTGKLSQSFGFRTTSRTRPAILANLVEFAREHINLINDRDTLEEMQSFVRNEKGRPEAMRGAHDDLVLALAIAEAVRERSFAAMETPAKKIRWEDDQWEDYRRASEPERRRMIKIWGEPQREDGTVAR